jgi:hypothetical protein
LVENEKIFETYYFATAESLTAGATTGAETDLAESDFTVSETTTSGSGNMLLLSVGFSFFEQFATNKPPKSAIANNFFIVNLI